MIWKTESEGKHKFFAWLLVQCKIPTADKLIPGYGLAIRFVHSAINNKRQQHISSFNVPLQGSFGRKWRHGCNSQFVYRKTDQRSLTCGKRSLLNCQRKTRRLKVGLMLYCAWNIWKEHNMRIFESKGGTSAEVMYEIKMEVDTRKLACGGQSYLSS